jgi:hypothetical protein
VADCGLWTNRSSVKSQRQLVADVLAVMSDHPADPLWQAWLDGELDRFDALTGG